MPSTFDQFVAYGTDIVGLERILRGIQSVLIILTSSPFLVAYLSTGLAPFLLSTPTPLTLLPTLALLGSKINLVRRTFRTFRFLEWFAAGLSLFNNGPAGLENWLNILKWNALGMYGLLETVTLLDVLNIPEIQFFTVERCRDLNNQAQICWFVALYAGVINAGFKMVKLWALKPADGVEVQGLEEKKDKEVVKANKEKAKKAEAERSLQMKGLGLQIVNDLMDMTLPAVVVGWIEMDSSVSGTIMLITTLITGRGIWNKMGKDMAAREAA